MTKRDEPTSVETGAERKSPSTSPLAARDSLPSVESSLDAFIARAHDLPESPTDGSDAVRRQIDNLRNGEQLLRRQIDDLRARLTETEARAARAPRRWPWVAGAFIVGAASMLAVSFIVPFTSHTTTTTAASPPPAPPVQLQVTPISPEPPAVAPPSAAVATPPSPPVVVENTPTPLPTPHRSHAKPKVPKQDTPPPDVTKPPPEPPPKSDESGSGLYNPF